MEQPCEVRVLLVLPILMGCLRHCLVLRVPFVYRVQG